MFLYHSHLDLNVIIPNFIPRFYENFNLPDTIQHAARYIVQMAVERGILYENPESIANVAIHIAAKVYEIKTISTVISNLYRF